MASIVFVPPLAWAVFRSLSRARPGQLRLPGGGAVVAVIPCVVLYVALQRYYIPGLTSGVVKS